MNVKMCKINVKKIIAYSVRNVTNKKIPLFSPNFFLTLITYGLLSYSVRFHCANIHTPLLFLLIFTAQNIKTRNSNLLGAREDH